jgi:hypothetical protein
MEEYGRLGHCYISDYSLNPSLIWVLAMSPLMADILGNAEFAEVDATFKASIELEYLLNVVCFDYTSLQCKLNLILITVLNYVNRGSCCKSTIK